MLTYRCAESEIGIQGIVVLVLVAIVFIFVVGVLAPASSIYSPLLLLTSLSWCLPPDSFPLRVPCLPATCRPYTTGTVRQIGAPRLLFYRARFRLKLIFACPTRPPGAHTEPTVSRRPWTRCTVPILACPCCLPPSIPARTQIQLEKMSPLLLIEVFPCLLAHLCPRPEVGDGAQELQRVGLLGQGVRGCSHGTVRLVHAAEDLRSAGDRQCRAG